MPEFCQNFSAKNLNHFECECSIEFLILRNIVKGEFFIFLNFYVIFKKTINQNFWQNKSYKVMLVDLLCMRMTHHRKKQTHIIGN